MFGARDSTAVKTVDLKAANLGSSRSNMYDP